MKHLRIRNRAHHFAQRIVDLGERLTDYPRWWAGFVMTALMLLALPFALIGKKDSHS